MASPTLPLMPSHTYNTLFLREKWLAIFRQHSVTLFHILAAVLGRRLGEGGDGGAVKATVYLEAGTKE